MYRTSEHTRESATSIFTILAITLSDSDWNRLLERIKAEKCTPFLGAGACHGSLPLAAELAEELARKYNYPFPDRDLTRISQYQAVHEDPISPKEDVIDLLERAVPPRYHPPRFNEPGQPHGTLAELPLPVFLTTNYDDFMVSALKSRHKDPRREICRWHYLLKPSVFETEVKEVEYKPTPACPLVFHLHGCMDLPESLVLTEDDYLTFLANLAGTSKLLPPAVEKAISATTVLFIGYRLVDWNFRVIFQALRPRNQFSSIIVLKPPEEFEPNREAQQAYLKRYFAAMQIKIYWGTAREFCSELKQRWTAFDSL
jgi:hypothetical protein